jgi:ribulose-phosphate 3-epimerase
MTIKNRVVPAVLTENPGALTSMVREAEQFSEWIQIDVMDGLFVPSRSVGAVDVANTEIRIGWEGHLMVKYPEKYLEDFKRAGAKRVIVHYEAVRRNPAEFIERTIRIGIKAGLALNPETEIGVLDDNLINQLDIVLFMAVHPGFYGARFIPESLSKIAEYKHRYPGAITGVDGGIKESNIEQVAQTGVNEICVGSAIFGQQNKGLAYSNLLGLAERGWAKVDN